jgi:hypothetical protein
MSSFKQDHKQASVTLYSVVALNSGTKQGTTPNKIEIATILADLLQIHFSMPLSWLRGDFKKHPLSRENFLRIVRAYRTKPGLESPKVIASLAINLYGRDYKKAIELLDPADRKEVPLRDIIFPNLPGQSKTVCAIYNLLESSPEAIEIALGVMTTYQWSTSVLLEKLREFSNEVGAEKIIGVIVSHSSDNLREAFSKLGGLPELPTYTLDSFEALWETTGADLREMLSFFETLNLIWAGGKNERKIKPQILDISRQYLGKLPKSTQRRAQNWWRRVLDKPHNFNTFRSRLSSRYIQLEQITGKTCGRNQQASLPSGIFKRVDMDKECMQTFSQYMSYDNFIFAHFILMHRKTNFRFTILVSLWLGTTPLLHRVPLLMIAAIGSGIFVMFRLMIDIHRSDIVWYNIWDEVIRKAKPSTTVVEDFDIPRNPFFQISS